MKAYYRIIIYLSLVLFTTGCSGQLSFDELTKDIPTNLNAHTYSSANMDYSISVLKNFELVDKDYYDTLGIELFIDTSMVFEEGASMLLVLKYNSTDTLLEKAWDKLMSNRVIIEDFRIYKEGLTNFLSIPAYYEHSACTISNKNTESISFFFRGDSSSFFGISLQVITEEGYPDNMKKLLYCAKSMKLYP